MTNRYLSLIIVYADHFYKLPLNFFWLNSFPLLFLFAPNSLNQRRAPPLSEPASWDFSAISQLQFCRLSQWFSASTSLFSAILLAHRDSRDFFAHFLSLSVCDFSLSLRRSSFFFFIYQITQFMNSTIHLLELEISWKSHKNLLFNFRNCCQLHLRHFCYHTVHSRFQVTKLNNVLLPWISVNFIVDSICVLAIWQSSTCWFHLAFKLGLLLSKLHWWVLNTDSGRTIQNKINRVKICWFYECVSFCEKIAYC